MQAERKLILFIAMSLDGYIAKPDDDISFLKNVEQAGEDYGFEEFVKTVDTVIIGRRTYDVIKAMNYSYPESIKDIFVITRTTRPGIGAFRFYNGNIKELVLNLKSEAGKNIYCDGGAEIVNELLKEELIDEFYISVIPILLGSGIALFKDGRPEMKLKLISKQNFEKGLVQLHYERV